MSTPAAHKTASDDLSQIKVLVAALDAKKAENIVVLDLRDQSSYLNYFVIATSLSRTHLKTLFDELHKTAVENGIERPRAQNPQFESGWVTYDFGFYVVHLFEDEKRKFYDLESVWKNAKRIDVLSQRSTDLTPRKGESQGVQKQKKAVAKKTAKTSVKSESSAKKKTTIKKKTTKEKTMATAKKKPAKKAAKKSAKKAAKKTTKKK
ncbi:ribosome silencing factor [Turneriella parva]|uniref:Ribosomal silencing factor RsfS n=1 Tax=Turneriella parva (strain ATCC BAA-1111 / DSM 21527 / NCTC 11395 / H) TaxID=869212 RepID=I4B2F1_TURPD|nr:ribosome silencing factor [Turneriella parva]AFM11458.1 iojap-like protein [Turneriella parva DSM 21527]